MASDKKEKKIQILLEGLSRKKLSLVEISELLNTNRSNSYNLINELYERGYEVKKEVDGKKVSYYLPEGVTHYTQISKNTLNKFIILNVLNRPEKFTRSKLVKYFEEKNEANPSVIIKKSRLYELIHEQLREKDIYMDGDILKVSNKGKDSLVSFQSLEDIYTLYYRINSIDKNSDEYKKLEKLNLKLSMLIGNIDQSKLPEDRFVVDARMSFDMGEVCKKMEAVANTSFREKVVKLSYQTKNKGERTVYVGIGITVFSPLKNNAFLLGWGFDEAKEEFPKNHLEIIPVDAVSRAEDTEFENPFYMDDYFKAHYDTMFIISSEGAKAVEVEFDKTDENLNRLSALCKHRPLATLGASEKKLYYADSISGINDAIYYVNTFTDSAKILKPKRMIEDQKVSVMKTLKRYEEV